MHRFAVKRLLQHSSFNRLIARPPPPSRLRFLSSVAEPPPFSHQNPNPNPNPNGGNTHQDPSSHTDTTHTHTPHTGSDTPRRTPTPRATYQEEQARVLASSLRHVIRMGWSEAAMIAGARDVGVSPSIVGAIPRKEAALVEYFMDECLQKLIDMVDSGELQLQDSVPSERIAKVIKARLQLQAPFISNWPQALSIQAQPANISTSFKQRAMLVDEFCHAANDEGSGVDWYLKRSIVGGIYSATEIYMLTDKSTDFDDTWVFLNERVRDAFDLKKTFQEVKYFAEAVGAGLGSSLQGFTKKGY